MSHPPEAIEALRARGVRITPQREAVLCALYALGGHVTAETVYEAIRQDMPQIGLATVYRNLEVFVRNGTARKLESGGRQARFDGNPQRHQHVRCVCCGRVADVHDAPTGLAQGKIKQLSGHEILGFRLEYVGICPACRQKVSPEERAQLHREWE